LNLTKISSLAVLSKPFHAAFIGILGSKMQYMKMKLFLLPIVLVATVSALAAPPEAEGKAIFTARCASCHSVNKVLTGPALAGVDERRNMDWIINFIQSSQTMVKQGDKQAVALFEQFNKIPMPDHPDLTAGQIKDVVLYIKSEAKAAAAEAKAPFGKPSKLRPTYTPLTFANTGFFIGYFVVVAMLILALLFAVQIKQYERRIRGED
jgi:mono/diheme cytochrome c family protein